MFEKSTVLITGGTGTLGRALVRWFGPNTKKTIILSRDEFKQSEMAKEFPYENLRFLLGDVRDKDRLIRAFEGVDYVIHAAALKQIPALEYNPEEAIKTNVLGTKNVIDACAVRGIDRAVLISTDKAVHAVNLYGATKMCGEKLFLAANNYAGTSFAVVRYGNVIGSRGSVIPFFQQLAKEGELTFPITDRRMTRFWITIDQAVQLVVHALTHDEEQVYIPDIPSMKIVDIAEAIDPDFTMKTVGLRPGEKLHEILKALDEPPVVMVNFDNGHSFQFEQMFTSDKNREMSKEEFKSIIEKEKVE